MLGWCELADAVAEVEDVCRAGGVGVGVGCAKAVQHAMDLGGDLRGWRKQDVGVDVALQRLARAADLTAHQTSCGAEVHGPVQAQHLTVQVFHLGQPQTAALGEHQPRNDGTVVAALELRQHTAGVGQAEVLESAIGQHAAPAVKHHHRLGTGFDLGI